MNELLMQKKNIDAHEDQPVAMMSEERYFKIIQEIQKKHPNLHYSAAYPDEKLICDPERLQNEKNRLLDYKNAVAFECSLDFLGNMEENRNIPFSKGTSSYDLKHLVEKAYKIYVPTGIFIAALYYSNFKSSPRKYNYPMVRLKKDVLEEFLIENNIPKGWHM